MNIHTRLIGAFDAVILLAAALVTVGFTAALLDPQSDRVTSIAVQATDAARPV